MVTEINLKDLESLIGKIREAEKFQRSFENYGGDISPGMKECLHLAALQRKENLKDSLQAYMKVDIRV